MRYKLNSYPSWLNRVFFSFFLAVFRKNRPYISEPNMSRRLWLSLGCPSTHGMSLGMVIHNGARIQRTHPDEDSALSGQRLHANRHWKQVIVQKRRHHDMAEVCPVMYDWWRRRAGGGPRIDLLQLCVF